MIGFPRAARATPVIGVLILLGGCDSLGFGDAPEAGLSGEDAAAILAAHNRYRARHCAPPLAWSEAVAREARRWAARCDFSHSGNGLGENIAWGTAGAYRPEFFIKAWYDEVADYDYASGRSRAGVVGHFTQVVWAGTTEIGCGWARCGVREFLVCNYSPPGNYRGRQARNVLPRC